MNLYVTSNTIKHLREQKKMTQTELADKIDVSRLQPPLQHFPHEVS